MFGPTRDEYIASILSQIQKIQNYTLEQVEEVDGLDLLQVADNVLCDLIDIVEDE